MLANGRWVRFLAASSVATPVGLLVGFIVSPSEDGIAQSYVKEDGYVFGIFID
jgi:hypothetical protein